MQTTGTAGGYDCKTTDPVIANQGTFSLVWQSVPRAAGTKSLPLGEGAERSKADEGKPRAKRGRSIFHTQKQARCHCETSPQTGCGNPFPAHSAPAPSVILSEAKNLRTDPFAYRAVPAKILRCAQDDTFEKL